MNIEQQRTLAKVRARMRIKNAPQKPPEKPAFEREAEETLSYTPAELIAGSAPVRFAMGAAAPIMGAAQLVAEALGFDGVSDQLKRVEALKKRGMEAYGNDQVSEALGMNETTDVVGTMGTVLSPVALKAMKIAPAASVTGRMGQGALIGGGFGAATPVTEGDNFWTSKAAQTATGTAIGGLVPGAIDATKTGYRFGRNIVDPMLPGGAERSAARMVAEAIKTRRPEVERLLRENRQFVPGSQPTAAEAASPAGVTELSGMQNLLAQKFPTRFRDIEVGQEAARKASIGQFAGDKSALASAVAKRAATAQNTYGAIADDVVASLNDTGLKPLLSRPSIDKAISVAKKLTQEQGAEWADDALTVRNLQNLKMALDDMVKDPATFGLGGAEANAISKTRSAFIDWFNKASPKWESARTSYASDSVPINRMQVGQELEKALTNPLGTAERPGVFAGAVQNAPRTIKRATGAPRFDEIAEIDPNLSKVADAVMADLQRKGTSDVLGRLGQNAAAELTGPAGLPATGPLHQEYMIFKTILGRVSKGTNEKSMQALANALETPQATLELLKKAPTPERQAIIESLLAQKFGRGSTIGATTLATGQEQF